jgi:hypothetical protein
MRKKAVELKLAACGYISYLARHSDLSAYRGF